MIIPLLVDIICNDACGEQSVISSAKDPFYIQDDNVCKKGAIMKRSNLDERISKKFDENMNFKTTLDNSEQKETTSLARKLANEALRSPQLQSNIKKLANLSEPRYNHSKALKDLLIDQRKMGNVFKPATNMKKLSKLSNKEKKKKTRNKHRHGIRRRNPGLHKQNYIKVGKISLYYLCNYYIYFL